ncbi:MAG: glycosyl transferase [Bacteroidetes bacterium]|nr:MAG: glycosyl transferase [Bacteroidota bacterium]
MIDKQKDKYIQFIIALIAALLFIPFIGNVHLFDWDEINFAESAREMIVSGDYLNVQINFIPFWEKPPLFIWIQVLSMKVFGINEFAARFPNAIIGIVTLLIIYNIGKRIYNIKFGVIWVVVYAASILPHFYFKSGIIDPLFNLFIFLGIYYFSLFDNKEGSKPLLNVILSATFIGLGILTKGPVAFLLFFLTALIYLIASKSYKKFLQLKVILVYAITVAFVGGFWFILQILSGNFNIIVDFIEYQIHLFSEEGAGHGGFFLYHFVVLFIGVFPASIFALKSFRKYNEESSEQKSFKRWMIILFWVVLILFTIVSTKIVHYSSMCYFPLTFLASYIIFKIIEHKQKFDLWMQITTGFLAIILGSTVIALQYIVKYKDIIIASDLIKDDFAVGNLQANVYWSGYEFLIGVMLIIGVISSIIFFKTAKKQIIGIFLSSLLFTILSMIIIVPRIEQYSQNAAIGFFKEIAKEDCYTDTYGYKSYANYFYFNKQIPENPNALNKNWLLKGDIDKTVYIVCKNTAAKNFEKEYPAFTKIEEKNGFVFFKRGKELNKKN